jgi:hypothetical protein
LVFCFKVERGRQRWKDMKGEERRGEERRMTEQYSSHRPAGFGILL